MTDARTKMGDIPQRAGRFVRVGLTNSCLSCQSSHYPRVAASRMGAAAQPTLGAPHVRTSREAADTAS